MSGHVLSFLVVCLSVAGSAAGGTIWYVDDTATGGDNGTSWTNAFVSLQSALGVATPSDEIRVAAGTYKPAGVGGSRTATFQLVNGVAVYGGFPDGGGAPESRDPEANVTTLSGDLNSDDSTVGNGENSFHVVSADGSITDTANTILDGFTITAGNADGDDNTAESAGGGILCSGGNPTITNCTIVRNAASRSGGGMRNSACSPELTNCKFNGNSTPLFGGGMYNDGSDPTLMNCTFSGNSAGSDGGAISNGGSSPTLINCTFSGNSAPFGSVMHNHDSNNLSSNPTLTNCILWGNMSVFRLAFWGSSPAPVATYCDIQGGYPPGTGNIDADPLFVRDPDPGPDGNWDGVDDDYGDLRLACESRCLDAGTNATSPVLPPTDLGGNPRIVNGTVDMGAWEGANQAFLLVPDAINVAASLSAANGQTTYDLRGDWSDTVNPNGAWSYNEGGSPLVERQADWGGIGGETFWSNTSSGTIPPAWCRAVTNYAGSPNWQPGDVIVHSTNPGSGRGNGNVTWTAPSDGTISVSGLAWDAYHDSDRDDRWRILVDETEYAARDSIYGLGKSDPAALFAANLLPGMSLDGINVTAGDVLRFEVEAKTYCGHFVGVDMQIDFTPVSEPLRLLSEPIVVPEGGTAAFAVRLACDPGGTVVVSVAYDTGDPDITVESGSTLTFDSSNWAVGQAVTLGAANDEDRAEGTTRFRIEGGGIAYELVTAREKENDIGPILFVDVNATGEGDGTSWANAFPDLQSALTIAASLAPNAVERIWVAKGTYTPSAKMDPADNRTATFQLINDVAIYGGFAGTEPATFDLADRDLVANKTILSGDLNGDDDTGGNNSENSYHIVVAVGLDDTDVLDGVTITAGNANGSEQNAGGGGMFNAFASPTITNCTFSGNRADYGGGGMGNVYDSSPKLTNCTFSGNTAAAGGGMVNAYDSSPVLTNCMFSGNAVSFGGGGIYCQGSSSATLTNCTFSGNTAREGGAVYNNNGDRGSLTSCTFLLNAATYGGAIFNDGSAPTLDDCTFESNSASLFGGGVHNVYNSSPVLNRCVFRRNTAGDVGGGMFNEDSGSHPTLTGCIFEGNSAAIGGGMCNQACTAELTLINCTFQGNWTDVGGTGGGMHNGRSSPELKNCTFAGNDATGGGGLYNDQGSPTIQNCIFWGNTAANGAEIVSFNSGSAFSYCDIAGSGGSASWDPSLGTDGGGNIDDDPLFVRNPDRGQDEQWGTADDDYGNLRLQVGSPCIDAGDNTAVPAGITSDLGGRPRFMEDRETANTGNGTPPIVDMGAYEFGAQPDLDFDGDVDGFDFLTFANCYNGSLRPPLPACLNLWADLESDGDVDGFDFLTFANCYNGSDRPPLRP